jgi:pyruvate dehydrogenase E2 component (dihydrolipoamide acetyltransferase)
MSQADIVIPELGEGIDGGDVIAIHVKVGDTVAEDTPLLELETGKATVDVPSPSAGTISEILVSEGDKVVVGAVIFRMSNDASAAPVAEAAAPTPAAAPEAPAEAAPVPAAAPAKEEVVAFALPELGEGIDGGDVITIHVKVGETISEDQALFELETGKATVDVPSPASGTLMELSIAEGDKIAVGAVYAKIKTAVSIASPAAAAASASAAAPAATATGSKAPASAPAAPAAPTRKAAKRADHVPVPAAPSIRKFAREIGINVREVPGTGKNGRISIDDVKVWSRQLNEGGAAAPGRNVGAPGIKFPTLPDFSTFGEIEKEEMTTIRQMTVNHMAACWTMIPHVTQHDHADITDLEALRKSFQKKAEAAGTKLTITAMLMKVLASALKVFPKFNASIDPETNSIIFKKYFNVGCAVDTPKGLLVPVLRDLDQKNMIEIAAELSAVADKMKSGKISPKELQGGCITLTNIGGLSGKLFTPIVNSPEVAILGVGRGSMQPVWNGEEFVPRLMMPLSLSYDHRLIDGADGTRFLRWIVEAIEQPLLISLEG